jgi:hypothetical protein
MSKKIFLCTFVFICLALISCNPTSSSTSTAITVSKLKINDGDASNWTVSSSGIYNSADDWASMSGGGVDGTAYEYTTSPGLSFTQVLDEKMTNTTGASMTIYVIDYSTAANATTMYNYEKSLTNWTQNKVVFDTYSDTVAVGCNSSAPNISACAHFKQFYIELGFEGETDITVAQNSAVIFLGIFEAKINGN